MRHLDILPPIKTEFSCCRHSCNGKLLCEITLRTAGAFVKNIEGQQMPVSIYYFVVFVLLLFIFPTACSMVTVRETSIEVAMEARRGDVITTGILSRETSQFVHVSGILISPEEHPDEAYRSLDALTIPVEPDQKWLALSELALYRALKTPFARGSERAAWFLAAAEKSFEMIRWSVRYPARLPGPMLERSRMYYNRAVAGFLKEHLRLTERRFEPRIFTVLNTSYDFRVEQGPEFEDPMDYAQIHVSDELKVAGLDHHYRTDGLGVALTGHVPNTDPSRSGRYLPEVGIFRPLSALISFEGGVHSAYQCRLAFYNSWRHETIRLEGSDVALSSDLSAPLAYLASATRRTGLAITETIHPDKQIEKAGFILLEPYDPNRIPLITVHGLLANPLTWANLHNDILGDPVLRRRYQIWHFRYPPGLHFLYSAYLFRTKLDEIYGFFDPQGQHKAAGNTVIVAHSMGGLLARTVSSDSGLRLWEALFSVPPKELPIDSHDTAWLRDVFQFKSKPYVKRIIFVATPHRGSALADGFLGAVGVKLIFTPRRVSGIMARLTRIGRQIVHPQALRVFTTGAPNSVKSLSPQSPVLRRLSELPLSRDIRFHTIIGDRGLKDAVEHSDGIVPYASSHLEGVDSELVVPADHAAHRHPLAVQEIRRILRLHLEESVL